MQQAQQGNSKPFSDDARPSTPLLSCEESGANKNGSKPQRREASSSHDWVVLSSPPGGASPNCRSPSDSSNERTSVRLRSVPPKPTALISDFERLYFEDSLASRQSVGTKYSDIRDWKSVKDELPPERLAFPTAPLSWLTIGSNNFGGAHRVALEDLKRVLSQMESKTFPSSDHLRRFVRWISAQGPSTGSLRWAVQEISRFPALLHKRTAPSFSSALLSAMTPSRLRSILTAASTGAMAECSSRDAPGGLKQRCSAEAEDDSFEDMSSSTESIRRGRRPSDSATKNVGSLERINRCFSLTNAAAAFYSSVESSRAKQGRIYTHRERLPKAKSAVYFNQMQTVPFNAAASFFQL